MLWHFSDFLIFDITKVHFQIHTINMTYYKQINIVWTNRVAEAEVPNPAVYI